MTETNDEARFRGIFAHLGAVTAYAARRGSRDPDGVAGEVMTIAWRRLTAVPKDDPLPSLTSTWREHDDRHDSRAPARGQSRRNHRRSRRGALLAHRRAARRTGPPRPAAPADAGARRGGARRGRRRLDRLRALALGVRR